MGPETGTQFQTRSDRGYEPTWSPAGQGAEAALVQGAVAALRDAMARQVKPQ